MTDHVEQTDPRPAKYGADLVPMQEYEHPAGTLLHERRWDTYHVVTDRDGCVYLMCCPRHAAEGWPAYSAEDAEGTGLGFYLLQKNGRRLYLDVGFEFEVTDRHRSATCPGAVPQENDDSD